MNDIKTMTQEQKDQLLNQLLAKQAKETMLAKFRDAGLTWSSNGYIAVKMPKIGDKNSPSLYVHPQAVEALASKLEAIKQFASQQ